MAGFLIVDAFGANLSSVKRVFLSKSYSEKPRQQWRGFLFPINLYDHHMSALFDPLKIRDIEFQNRAMLRNPRWAINAAEKLGVKIAWPLSLDRARTLN